jgi:hypothetical protein
MRTEETGKRSVFVSIFRPEGEKRTNVDTSRAELGDHLRRVGLGACRNGERRGMSSERKGASGARRRTGRN